MSKKIAASRKKKNITTQHKNKRLDGISNISPRDDRSQKDPNHRIRVPIKILALGVALLVSVGVNLFYLFGRTQKPAPPVPPALTSQQIADLYHQEFYDSPNTWRMNKWLGILTEQNPNDVWIIQEIIVETRPDFIIETGTLCGGSAALWSTILEQVNPKGRVITIDIMDQAQEARELPIVQRHVDFLHGSSTATFIVNDVKNRVKGKKVLVILDSDHSKQHVLNELAAYAPLVNVGGYLIVQDTDVNGHPVDPTFGPGPMEAIEEFLASNGDFLPDKERERLMFSTNPNGYLKRIR
jgi:cephalosporin hydroxylase